MLSYYFIKLLHLYTQSFLLPEIRQLLGSSPTTELYSTVCHIAFGSVHEAHEARLVLGIVEVGVWVIWIEPRRAEIAEMRLALRARHVIT
jgi:hypothetical protein